MPFTQLRFIGSALDALCQELDSLQPVNVHHSHVAPLQFSQSIELRDVFYRYPGSPNTALNCINVSIDTKSIVGFVGSTGSGKTTIVDLILGLLEPQRGQLIVDGEEITKSNRLAWSRSIGFVPQHIYLADATVAANIAFGMDLKDIDQQAVERAAKIASLHNFVVDSLPQGYETNVGERGLRLSGGQRQRIGVARALYHKPKVLILDEATSALDSRTEKDVFDALNMFSKETTIIMVSHRLSTVRKCDQIFLVERGEVKVNGTYDELIENSLEFKLMANSA